MLTGSLNLDLKLRINKKIYIYDRQNYVSVAKTIISLHSNRLAIDSYLPDDTVILTPHIYRFCIFSHACMFSYENPVKSLFTAVHMGWNSKPRDLFIVYFI